MIDSTLVPDRKSWRYKFNRWFVNHINFCHGYYYDTSDEKPQNKIYNFLYKYWLWPFEQTDCLCCNTVRGLMYGAVLGYLLGRLF